MTWLLSLLLALLTALMPAAATPRTAPSAAQSGAPHVLRQPQQVVLLPGDIPPERSSWGGAPQPAVPSGANPTPAPSIGTGLAGGYATWFDAPGLQAAVPWWQPGQDQVQLRVCAEGSRCIIVTATGFCACGDRGGKPTVADLSRAAFAAIAPLSDGLVLVEIEWPIGPLPATDMEGTR